MTMIRLSFVQLLPLSALLRPELDTRGEDRLHFTRCCIGLFEPDIVPNCAVARLLRYGEGTPLGQLLFQQTAHHSF